MYYLSLFVSKIYFLPSQEINLSRVACKLYNHNFLAKVTFRRGGRNATIISLSRSTIKSYSIKNRWFLICWRWNNKYEKRFVHQLCNYLFGKRINNSFFFFFLTIMLLLTRYVLGMVIHLRGWNTWKGGILPLVIFEKIKTWNLRYVFLSQS